MGAPLCDRDCSAFSKARLISLTLTARRLFLQKDEQRRVRELDVPLSLPTNKHHQIYQSSNIKLYHDHYYSECILMDQAVRV